MPRVPCLVLLLSACGISQDAGGLIPRDAREEQAALPPPTTPVTKFEDLRDTAGPVPGLPGVERARAPSDIHCGGVELTTRRTSAIPDDDEPLARIYALEFPTGLDFSPPAPTRSLERFQRFTEELVRIGQLATDHYGPRVDSEEPAIAVAAAARLAQVRYHAAALLLHAEIPVDVRSGEQAADKTAAYCDRLEEAAEPLVRAAEQAAAVCAERARDAGPGWWTRVCGG